jgi:hypothetical protein
MKNADYVQLFSVTGRTALRDLEELVSKGFVLRKARNELLLTGSTLLLPLPEWLLPFAYQLDICPIYVGYMSDTSDKASLTPQYSIYSTYLLLNLFK